MMTALCRSLGAALLTAFAANIHAGPLEDTCDSVYRKLAAGPRVSLTRSSESFTVDGAQYRGCVIHLVGNSKTATATQHAEGLFGASMPYCPDGKLPADLPRDLVNEDGWCGDKMADGPDGTFYRALKNGVFCAVEGRWDGGDDADPAYVPSPTYEVIVKCAKR